MQTIMFRALEQIEGRHKTHSPACWNTFKRGDKMLRQKLNIPDLERGIVISYCSQLSQPAVYFFQASILFSTEKAHYWPILVSFWPILAILSRIYALFGLLFTGLDKAVVYQTWQRWGIRHWKRSHGKKRSKWKPLFWQWWLLAGWGEDGWS